MSNEYRIVKRLLAIYLAIVGAISLQGIALGQISSTFSNSIGMEFVLIPAGAFDMGTPMPACPPDDPSTPRNENADCLSKVNPNEIPRHRVTISHPFYLGKYEVTQEEWSLVMKNNPARFKFEKTGSNSNRYPIENVSWEEVRSFITKLNSIEIVTVYRLPTEAEWEYAVHAGSTGEYYGNLEEIAWYDKNAGKGTHPVGGKLPNAWGLFDMLGNVAEWCSDWYDGTYYGRSPSSDPKGEASGLMRVMRGGSWNRSARLCRSATRSFGSPSYRFDSLGFRLAKSINP